MWRENETEENKGFLPLFSCDKKLFFYFEPDIDFPFLNSFSAWIKRIKEKKEKKGSYVKISREIGERLEVVEDKFDWARLESITWEILRFWFGFLTFLFLFCFILLFIWGARKCWGGGKRQERSPNGKSGHDWQAVSPGCIPGARLRRWDANGLQCPPTPGGHSRTSNSMLSDKNDTVGVCWLNLKFEFGSCKFGN